jgi:hypothetical protein
LTSVLLASGFNLLLVLLDFDLELNVLPAKLDRVLAESFGLVNALLGVGSLSSSHGAGAAVLSVDLAG